LEAIANAGLTNVQILEETAPYEKGKIRVASFTLSGTRGASTAPLRARAKCCCS
jgi:hypothetical protein